MTSQNLTKIFFKSAGVFSAGLAFSACAVAPRMDVSSPQYCQEEIARQTAIIQKTLNETSPDSKVTRAAAHTSRASCYHTLGNLNSAIQDFGESAILFDELCRSGYGPEGSSESMCQAAQAQREAVRALKKQAGQSVEEEPSAPSKPASGTQMQKTLQDILKELEKEE